MFMPVLNIIVLEVLHVVFILKIDLGVERDQLGDGRVAQQPVRVVPKTVLDDNVVVEL